MNASKELIRQLIVFTSILAGFSFASVLQLLTLNNTRRLVTWIIGSLTVATLLLLSSTFIGSILLYKLELFASPQEFPPHLVRFYGGVGVMELFILLAGLLLFSIGVGLSGWIRSRSLGMISSFSAAITLGLMLWALAVLFTAA